MTFNKGWHIITPTGENESKENNTMLVYNEMKLRDFEFWAGAVDRVKELTWEQLDTIEAILEDIYPNGINETQLNDLFWHDMDTIYEWLGLNKL
ncbi:MAG: hypothetical protein FWE06_06640 [Oscillospiraceae bacterium]|nr:hypothetical protein [Oscillospiraceae bacterium]